MDNPEKLATYGTTQHTNK